MTTLETLRTKTGVYIRNKWSEYAEKRPKREVSTHLLKTEEHDNNMVR
jgi:hypothetical protein